MTKSTAQEFPTSQILEQTISVPVNISTVPLLGGGSLILLSNSSCTLEVNPFHWLRDPSNPFTYLQTPVLLEVSRLAPVTPTLTVRLAPVKPQ